MMASNSHVPKEVRLDKARKTIVGRCLTETDDNNACVILNSPKIPGMLSKSHSILVYDRDRGQWTVEDLKAS